MAGQLLFSWIDAAGSAHALNGLPYTVAVHGEDGDLTVAGLMAPPWEPVERDVAMQGGAFLGYANAKARDMTLPLLIESVTSFADLWAKYRQLVSWMDPVVHGQAYSPSGASPFAATLLQVTAPDGAVRQIPAVVAGGLSDFSFGNDGSVMFQQLMLQLRAVYPYWQDTTDTTIASQAIVPGVNGLYGAGTNPVVTTPGDAECWPVWTISYQIPNGTAAQTVKVKLYNQTTALTCELTIAEAANGSGATVFRTITVDTRPGKKTVTWNGVGSVQMGFLSLTSALWALVPTSGNTLNLYASTSAASAAGLTNVAVSGTYRGQYNTP